MGAFPEWVCADCGKTVKGLSMCSCAIDRLRREKLPWRSAETQMLWRIIRLLLENQAAMMERTEYPHDSDMKARWRKCVAATDAAIKELKGEK